MPRGRDLRLWRYVVKKAMLLHFKCEAPTATRFCVLPGSTFTTETMEWSRWLKMGLSAAKLGKSILSADALACHGIPILYATR